ncbi:MAG: zinc ABC transporter substrate-binding protein [Candidatus Wallbacteria bacterium]|nr:zinc ABC transporter substrate-binding protein [Candidatus Wallbacteria bacterium]
MKLKRCFGFSFATLFALTLLALPAGTAFAKVNFVASLPDLADLVKTVGGDRVEVMSIGKGSQDPHFVDPKPSFMVKLRQADLFCVTGLELEIGWVPPLLGGAGNAGIAVGTAGYVDCSAGIPVLELPAGEVTRAEGDIHPFGNPHYMLDPLNGILVAAHLASALKQKDPAGAAVYDANVAAFTQQIYEKLFGKDLVDMVGGAKLDRMARSGELDGFLQSNPSAKLGGWLGLLKPMRNKPIVMYHKNYSYFADRFKLEIAEYVEPKLGIPPSAKHMVDVVALIKARNVKVIGTQPFYDDRAPNLIASKTGAKVLVMPSTVNQVNGVATYIQLFDYVTSKLAEAGK